jgi:Bacterial Ig domain/FlgD Ig-like domain
LKGVKRFRLKKINPDCHVASTITATKWGKQNMNKINVIAVSLITSLVSTISGFSQNTLQFTSVNTTPEKAIQLHWASNTNEIYEIDYANSLLDTNTGLTTWTPLYNEYPSQGTNTFWLDTGNYNVSPAVLHPRLTDNRFYRVVLTATNNTPTNPTISITSPSNGDVVSSNLTVSFTASSADVIAEVKLYVDGQEMPPSSNGTNFVINTCEWWNGTHTLFATAKSVTHFEGIANDTSVLYGHSVSAYVNVVFSNLITEVAFSQPYFEPSLGQTQEVTAAFTANCNWTLQILNAYGTAVRTQTGSGSSLLFDWDGTGDSETSIPDGVYSYLITASTNGAPMALLSSGPSAASLNVTNIWALEPGSEDPVPFAIYPIGYDTNGMTIFKATQAQINYLIGDTDTTASVTSSGSRYFTPMGAGAAGSSQSTLTPMRPPTAKGKGTIGTFYAGYQNYFIAPYLTFTTPPILSGNPFVNKFVQVDGQANQSQASQPEHWGQVMEFGQLANGFVTAMQGGRYKGSVNPFILSSDVTGGIFNSANVGLLCCHCSYGTSAESDGAIRSYLRFFNAGTTTPTFCKLDACSFGGATTNGLKWMAILACGVLQNSGYNSLYSLGRLPINEDLHLLLTTSTVATAAPTIGSLWANNMLGDGTTNVPPETVEQSWFDAGTVGYVPETNHITIVFRVAGWPDAFSEHLSDVAASPGTGNVLDITKQDQQVYTR